ncbi:MAG TPA: hypothetical protein ENK80_05710 [Rhodobacterales bacterium]|nr:hypothetical protein [Rhodobacterales bacterium]
MVIEEIPAQKSEPDSKKDAPAAAATAVAGVASGKKPEPKPSAKPVDPPQPPKADDPKDAPKPTPAAPKRGAGATGFVSLLLGGVAAAVIGFVAARYIVPEGWPFPGVAPEPDPLALAIDAQAEEIAALTAKVATLEADSGENTSGLADLTANTAARMDEFQAEIDGALARLDADEARLAAVERLAPEGSAAAKMAAEAYQQELAALRGMFEGELAKVEAAQVDASTLEAQAQEAAAAAAARAALARVTAALETGEPYEGALGDLTAAADVEVPEGLAQFAADGVPTLASLQETFAPAARASLDAATRAQVESGEVSRFSAFVKTQLGTRSLEPREGDDPDAVLSRAEAAVKQGDIGAALVELDALPEAAHPAMAEWRAMAEKRKTALDASAALAQDLNAK